MNSFKPNMSLEEVKEFLQQVEGANVSDVSPIEMGELSRVFSFSKDNQEFVIHFKDSRDSLEKAKYMYDHYSVHGVPIPRVIDIGSTGQLYYSITEKVPGKAVSTFKEKEILGTLDKLAKEFVNINQIKVDKAKGFGWISPSGTAPFNSWTECLAAFFNIEEGGFYGDWTRLYKESFLERELFEEIYAIMIELSKYSPEEPNLVHGDFHLGNMLSDGSDITGIVDWEMAMYGDFMLDLGVMHFWTPDLHFPQRVHEVWEKSGRKINYFEERLLCNQLFKGVDGLRFFAKKDDRQGYDYVKNKLLDLLKKSEF